MQVTRVIELNSSKKNLNTTTIQFFLFILIKARIYSNFKKMVQIDITTFSQIILSISNFFICGYFFFIIVFNSIIFLKKSFYHLNLSLLCNYIITVTTFLILKVVTNIENFFLSDLFERSKFYGEMSFN